MVVLPGYAVGDQLHRLLFIGCSFRNYQVVGSLQILIPLNLDRSSRVYLLLYSPIPSRGNRHLTISELLLQLTTCLPPDDVIPDSVEFAQRPIHIEGVEILRGHIVAQQRYLQRFPWALTKATLSGELLGVEEVGPGAWCAVDLLGVVSKGVRIEHAG